MITEIRAVQADLAAREKFVEDGGEVRETRGIIRDLTEPAEPDIEVTLARSGARLAAAEREGFVEVG